LGEIISLHVTCIGGEIVKNAILQVKNLTKVFKTGFIKGFEIRAVDNVNFTINRGEIVSLIGESGSGKTTIGKLILRLLTPTSGQILFRGQDVSKLKGVNLKAYYQNVQGVFQDPFSSVNPLYKVDHLFDIIFTNLLTDADRERQNTLIEGALRSVKLNPKNVLGKYPHQLSGGQLQRVLLARALILRPELLIADEIVSMLDASVRIGVLNLLGEFRNKYGMSVLFITHDLSLGYYISDKAIIMYRGTIVEMGDIKKVFHNPLHPYTQMLLQSVPDLNVKWELKRRIKPEKEEKGIYAIDGCRYAPRCPKKMEICQKKRPELLEVEKDHWVACYIVQ